MGGIDGLLGASFSTYERFLLRKAVGGDYLMDIDHALTDPGFFADHDPHPLWQQLRREDPIHWTEGRVRPFWSITRYDDIVAAFSEPNLFTSSRGVIVPSSPEMEEVTPETLGAGQMMIM